MIGRDIKGVSEIGNIIKINMYAKMKRKNNTKISLKNIEEIILKYKKWLKKYNKEDRVENYKRFLQEQ